MAQRLVRDQETAHDHPDQQQTTHEQQAEPEQQTTLIQEPTSDQGTPRDRQVPPTPESNEEALRQHQKHLRSEFPSCDFSEVSYHTEQTAFPGSRHSSINTEPLTLDAEQIHEAKDQAVEVIQTVDPEEAFDIFTKDTLSTIMGRVSMMEYYWRHGQENDTKSEEVSTQESEGQVLANQINSLVDKAQQVVEANEHQQSKSVNKPPGVSSVSIIEDRKGPNSASSVEDVKLKAD
ncbi:unnamed protein product [Calypogeia fissa]